MQNEWDQYRAIMYSSHREHPRHPKFDLIMHYIKKNKPEALKELLCANKIIFDQSTHSGDVYLMHHTCTIPHGLPFARILYDAGMRPDPVMIMVSIQHHQCDLVEWMLELGVSMPDVENIRPMFGDDLCLPPKRIMLALINHGLDVNLAWDRLPMLVHFSCRPQDTATFFAILQKGAALTTDVVTGIVYHTMVPCILEFVVPRILEFPMDHITLSRSSIRYQYPRFIEHPVCFQIALRRNIVSESIVGSSTHYDGVCASISKQNARYLVMLGMHRTKGFHFNKAVPDVLQLIFSYDCGYTITQQMIDMITETAKNQRKRRHS